METWLPLSSMQELLATCRIHLIYFTYLNGLQDVRNFHVARNGQIYRMERFYENSLQI